MARTARVAGKGQEPLERFRNRIVGHGDVDPREIVQHPKNARAHPRYQAEAMAGVLEDLGWIATVTINQTTGTLLDGHLRVAIAIKRGEPTVPVTYVELTEAEEEEALLTRDYVGSLAALESKKVDELLRSIDTGNAAVQDLLARLGKDAGLYRDQDEATADGAESVAAAKLLAEKWGTKVGQLWEIGDHRLLIGDATKPDSYKRLLEGELVDLVYTDPPYGVSYDEIVDSRRNQKEGGWAPIANDGLEGAALERFLAAAFKQLARASTSTAAFYIWHATKTRQLFEAAMLAAGLVENQYIIWAKASIMLGRSDYQWAYEPCFYAEKAGASAAWHGGRDQATLWRLAQRTPDALAAVVGPGLVVADDNGVSLYIAPKAPKGRKVRVVRITADRGVLLQPDLETADVWEIARDHAVLHPTQKPAALAVRAIENSSLPDQAVLDVFTGAGGTVVACEQTGRRARAMELSPAYAAVTLERMAELEPRLIP